MLDFSEGPSVQAGPSQVQYSTRAIVYVCLTCGLCDGNFSMLMAFFPAVAAKHGCSSTLVGMIFGVQQLFALIATPLAPSVCSRYGGARVQLVAVGVLGGLTIGFAFTDLCSTQLSFTLACMGLRMAQGLAAAFVEVAGVGLLMRCKSQPCMPRATFPSLRLDP